MKIILHWIIISVAVLFSTRFISGINVDPLWVVLIVGACLTLFNMFIKPVVSILTLPLNIVTLGIFSLIVNGLLYWYLGSIIKGFSVSTFSAAFFGALLVSVVDWMLKKVFHLDY
ncbi:phage holin family protein [Candidatus Nomurabacteria bacterium]|nr:phage holin family protein [Candidatus Nomurabacteria bacterium]